MATLVSVNVGKPTNVDWHGRTVHTAAWKEPVVGPRHVRRLNIDGDGQGDLGGHGGENRAVLVYQAASYRYWARELGRDDLAPGSLGENLTVDGLPDDEVCIGDRYRIGTAVFEVTQPRVTCYRAGLRIGEPRMAALLVAHHRPGFYCRVLTEGEIEAGQDIVKIASDLEQVTVAEVDALLYLPGHPRDGLDRALRVPALSPGWQTSLQNLADQARKPSGAAGNTGLTAAAGTPPPAWPGFRPLVVSAVHGESGQVRSLVLADVSGEQLPAWLPGQSLVLRLPRTADGGTLVRNYSLSNLSGSGRYRISVKREDHGEASSYLHGQVAVGDVLQVAAPRGTFFLAEGAAPLVLVSAGIGVTPVLAMLHWLAASRSDRRVWWLHGARDGSEHPFAAEVRALLEQLPQSRSSIYYSKPRPADRQGIDYTERGRLSVDALASLNLPVDAEAYLCGPTTFMSGLAAGLVAAGLDPLRIYSETYGAGAALTPGIAATAAVTPHQPDGPPGRGPEVQFARSSLTVRWRAQSASLLELAEACDVPTRWSCRTGVCHNCETSLLSGAVRYDPEPLEPAAAGNVLLCCARPVEPLVLDL